MFWRCLWPKLETETYRRAEPRPKGGSSRDTSWVCVFFLAESGLVVEITISLLVSFGYVRILGYLAPGEPFRPARLLVRLHDCILYLCQPLQLGFPLFCGAAALLLNEHLLLAV